MGEFVGLASVISICEFVMYQFLCLPVLLFCLGITHLSSQTLAAETDVELIDVVERSCKKACVGGKGEQAFCSSYCQCVSNRVEDMASGSDISKVLSERSQQNALINQCSGQTAVKFFAQSCRDKCAGVPKCNAYCSCLEEKIQYKRKLSDIGVFFIGLGKNETRAVGRLKSYEAACIK